MASYGALLRSITTAEINRLYAEGGYRQWAYFIDQTSAKVGVVFASDTTFAAYTIADEPDPKLYRYGLEAIKDLTLTPDPRQLVLTAGQNRFQAVVFNDPTTVYEDEFLPSFTYVAVDVWQRFLETKGVKNDADSSAAGNHRWFLAVVAGIVLLLIVLALH